MERCLAESADMIGAFGESASGGSYQGSKTMPNRFINWILDYLIHRQQITAAPGGGNPNSRQQDLMQMTLVKSLPSTGRRLLLLVSIQRRRESQAQRWVVS